VTSRRPGKRHFATFRRFDVVMSALRALARRGCERLRARVVYRAYA
jgi:hypothetical protein